MAGDVASLDRFDSRKVDFRDDRSRRCNREVFDGLGKGVRQRIEAKPRPPANRRNRPRASPAKAGSPGAKGGRRQKEEQEKEIAAARLAIRKTRRSAALPRAQCRMAAHVDVPPDVCRDMRRRARRLRLAAPCPAAASPAAPCCRPCRENVPHQGRAVRGDRIDPQRLVLAGQPLVVDRPTVKFITGRSQLGDLVLRHPAVLRSQIEPRSAGRAKGLQDRRRVETGAIAASSPPAAGCRASRRESREAVCAPPRSPKS